MSIQYFPPVQALGKEEVFRQSLAKLKVPERLHDELLRYVIDGVQPESFLLWVLADSFMSAVVRADEDLSSDDLRSLARWIHNEAPSACHGSPTKVREWMVAKAKELGVRS